MARPPDDSFLARWSRRKRTGESLPEEEGTADAGSTTPVAAAHDDTASAVNAGDGAHADEAGDPEVLARLPEIDSLDYESDFTPFFQQGVPESLRRKALRKLWRSHPLLANLDGLNDYDEDFTMVGMVDMPDLRSVYRVGRGIVLDDETGADGDVNVEAEGVPRADDVLHGESTQSEEIGGQGDDREPASLAVRGDAGDDVKAASDAETAADSQTTTAQAATVQPDPLSPLRSAMRHPPVRSKRHVLARRWGIDS